MKWLIFIILFTSFPLKASEVKRTLLGLYIPTEDGIGAKQTLLHRYAEMPLNHLGWIIDYHPWDPKNPPDLSTRPDLAGVITWYTDGLLVDEPHAYLKIFKEVRARQLKVLIMGNQGFEYPENDPEAILLFNSFWRYLGLSGPKSWRSWTYRDRLQINHHAGYDYERKFSGRVPNYAFNYLINPDWKKWLTIHSPIGATHPIITGPHGGYAAPGFIIHESDTPNERQWYLNPFLFFQMALGPSSFPIPDTTTINGLRLFFSHIDGDGWNSLTLIGKYKPNPPIAAEVIYEEILKKNPDLPVTVAPIISDLKEKLPWGRLSPTEITHKIFNLPHIQGASHTWTHPFDWYFFDNYSPEKEQKFLNRYHNPNHYHATSLASKLTKFFYPAENQNYTPSENELKAYEIPRAFYNGPFELQTELVGSIDYLKQNFPKANLAAPIIFWSGDTTPFEQALTTCRENNLLNINGGDARYDNEYPSIIWLPPISRQVGKERQIYAVNSNENTYTNLWTANFYGFQNLTKTWERTESPRRLKGQNLYYHAYSGERLASLNALNYNIAHLRKNTFHPITTAQYCRLAQNFFDVQFKQLAPQIWSIQNRGSLNTFRFDQAVLKTVDFSQSRGVLGFRHYQGSLYIFTDPQFEQPILALKNNPTPHQYSSNNSPYLIQSRHQITGFAITPEKCSFYSYGFGEDVVQVYLPKGAKWSLIVNAQPTTLTPIGANTYQFKTPPTQNTRQPNRIIILRATE